MDERRLLLRQRPLPPSFTPNDCSQTAANGLSVWLVWRRAGPQARNGFADLFPLRLRRIPRGSTSSAAAVLRYAAALAGAGGPPIA